MAVPSLPNAPPYAVKVVASVGTVLDEFVRLELVLALGATPPETESDMALCSRVDLAHRSPQRLHRDCGDEHRV